MRYTIHVCITFGYEPKTYIYVKDNKSSGKIKDKIQLDFNPLRHLKKIINTKHQHLMHLKYGVSICPPVFAYLVEMCIFKVSPLLRWIIDLKVCVKFHASLFFDKQQKRWRSNVRYFFHNALRNGTEYKLHLVLHYWKNIIHLSAIT